jgi:lipid-binding SYLF domain-containing protein
MRAWLGRVETATLVVLVSGALVSGAAGAEKPKEEQRAEVRKAANETLARLYQVQPGAKATIEKAAGYAVFNSFGMKIGVAGTGRGKGLAVDKGSGRETFMKMLEVQAGLGFGVKKFQLVWVFETPAALTRFTTSGWELGGQTTASAKAKEQGAAMQGALAVSPGVWLYQLTESGLALELTAKGTKYLKDGDLN